MSWINILILLQTMILVNSIQYLPYRHIRLQLLDLYHIYNSKEVSLEHIVPQSIFKKINPEISRDMHNIIMYPSLLNSHRSNYRYVNKLVLDDTTVILDKVGNPIPYTGPFIDSRFCLKSNKYKTYYPRPLYRGSISRACMYIAKQYPQYSKEVLDYLIDPYVLLTWHHQHPVSDFDKRKNDKIYELQGNYNSYIDNPQSMVTDIEKWVGKTINTYKYYRYIPN